MTYSETPPKRWDPIVKITHWGIASAIVANALFTGEGSGWHIWVGYGLAGLLGLRLLWALVGSENARFNAFPPSPIRAIRYLKEQFSGRHVEHASHNPLGALMVYALWSCLALIIASGIAMSGPPPASPNAGRSETEQPHSVPAGPANVEDSEGQEGEDAVEESEAASGFIIRGTEDESEGAEWLEEVHETAVNLLYMLIVLHILGVAVETVRHGRKTVRAMLPFSNRRMQ